MSVDTRQVRWVLAFMITLACCHHAVVADDGKKNVTTVYPVAILPFQERGQEVKDMGAKVTDLLFANLVARPEMYLVDREDLKKILEEQELNLSGVVNPTQATQVGQLTGAKILITGSVLAVGEKIYIVAKIIGTETSRVVGQSVKGDLEDPLDKLVEKLSMSVADAVDERAHELVASPVTREDRLARLRKTLGKSSRPTVTIKVAERHVGQPTLDPAAETELTLFCTELGFKVLEADAKDKPDVMLIGEGFSQFAARHGNLTSVKARLELKAVDVKTGQVLAVDRCTSVAVGLAEQIAAKSALQDAAARVAESILPALRSKQSKGEKGSKREKGGKAGKGKSRKPQR